MIFLIILGVILLLALLILFLPIRVDLEYNEVLKLKVSLAKITLYRLKEGEKTAEMPQGKSRGGRAAEKSGFLEDIKSHFTAVKKEQGFVGLVKEITSLIRAEITHISKLISHIKMEKTGLFITVATDDAAKTAFDYGLVCDAVYPVTAMLDSRKNISFKEINVSSDFEKNESSFGFKTVIKAQPFFLGAAAVKILLTLKKFVTENKNERK